MSDNETADLRKVAQQAADRGSLLHLNPTTVLNLLHELDDLRTQVREAKVEALREAADEERDRMSAAWGGGSRWLTTGDSVANLACGWLRDRADRIASGGQA